MTKTKTTPKKIGRPRKFAPGRVGFYVRVTPERAAILKGQAEHNGRSISEQIEFELEWASAEKAFRAAQRFNAELRGLSEKRVKAIIDDSVKRMLEQSPTEQLQELFAALKRSQELKR